MDATGLSGQRIVITGATGQVGLPVARALARDNEVWAAARFSNPAARRELEAAGVRCAAIDFSTGDLEAIPDGIDYALHLAVSRSADFDTDLTDNAEATGLLMARCQGARAFLFCSSTAVYEPKGHDAITERDPLGDNHRVMFPTYSIVKIATEAVVRTAARLFNLPSIITRLNVPYGGNGGWPYFHVLMMQAGMDIPVHVDAPSVYNPIHETDIIGALPYLLDAAAVPAPIFNLCGDEQVSIEEWCAYLGELTGLNPKIAPTDQTIESVASDNAKLRALGWKQTVSWREGMRKMVETRFPELVQQAATAGQE